jgi:hypothetical protein
MFLIENKENEEEWNQKSWENLLLKVIFIAIKLSSICQWAFLQRNFAV